MKKINYLIVILLSSLALSVNADLVEGTDSAGESIVASAMETGKTLALSGRSNEAYASFQNAMKQAETLFGKSSLAYARLNLEAGAFMVATVEPAKARAFLVPAHEYFSRELGQSHPNTALAAVYLGKYWITQGREQQALPMLESGLSVLEQVGTHPSLLAETHALIVKAHEEMGQPTASAPHLQDIGELIAAGYGEQFRERPIYAVSPVYPEFSHCGFGGDRLSPCNHYARNSEAEIAFEVNEQGVVSNPRVVDSQGDSKFTEAALVAVQQFRYAPRIVDGRAVVIEDMTFRFATSGR